MDDKKYIELGVCKSPHGIRGGFSFYLHNPDESILKKGSQILLFPLSNDSSVPKDGFLYKIKEISFGNKVIVYFENIVERNAVEAMIPFSINIPRKEFPPISENEHYLVDLIGLKVFDFKTKKIVGVIDSFYENGFQLIVVVRGEQSFELPFIDVFFPIIDPKAERIEMIVPEYLNE